MSFFGFLKAFFVYFPISAFSGCLFAFSNIQFCSCFRVCFFFLSTTLFLNQLNGSPHFFFWRAYFVERCILLVSDFSSKKPWCPIKTILVLRKRLHCKRNNFQPNLLCSTKKNMPSTIYIHINCSLYKHIIVYTNCVITILFCIRSNMDVASTEIIF